MTVVAKPLADEDAPGPVAVLGVPRPGRGIGVDGAVLPQGVLDLDDVLADIPGGHDPEGFVRDPVVVLDRPEVLAQQRLHGVQGLEGEVPAVAAAGFLGPPVEVVDHARVPPAVRLAAGPENL
ncbi:hypothetical protein [Streptomyces halobius]|uniref:Uncharacterized protein n=1 Tax=Streptomyces halobius TaxID=2879846 RepID=A0ABY4MIY7_9ACTN|nr:hypothetical protein [Streptomyces halobius]UQA97048.1 hypothetical protein K9S39_38880 [Streptomyces halobius]